MSHLWLKQGCDSFRGRVVFGGRVPAWESGHFTCGSPVPYTAVARWYVASHLYPNRFYLQSDLKEGVCQLWLSKVMFSMRRSWVLWQSRKTFRPNKTKYYHTNGRIPMALQEASETQRPAAFPPSLYQGVRSEDSLANRQGWLPGRKEKQSSGSLLYSLCMWSVVNPTYFLKTPLQIQRKCLVSLHLSSVCVNSMYIFSHNETVTTASWRSGYIAIVLIMVIAMRTLSLYFISFSPPHPHGYYFSFWLIDCDLFHWML